MVENWPRKAYPEKKKHFLCYTLYILLLFYLLAIQIASADLGGAESGQDIFESHCASCHVNSQVQAPSLMAMRDMQGATIMRSLTKGKMGFVGEKLSAEQRLAVVEYISGTPYQAQQQNPAVAAPNRRSGVPSKGSSAPSSSAGGSWVRGKRPPGRR